MGTWGIGTQGMHAERVIHEHETGLRWMRRKDRRGRDDSAGILAKAFQNLGIDFIEQAEMVAQGGHYRVDLFFPDRRMVVEVDGREHDARGQQEADDLRDAHLLACGLRVVRVAREEVLADAVACTEAILAGKRNRWSAFLWRQKKRLKRKEPPKPRLKFNGAKALMDAIKTPSSYANPRRLT